MTAILRPRVIQCAAFISGSHQYSHQMIPFKSYLLTPTKRSNTFAWSQHNKHIS